MSYSIAATTHGLVCFGQSIYGSSANRRLLIAYNRRDTTIGREAFGSSVIAGEVEARVVTLLLEWMQTFCDSQHSTNFDASTFKVMWTCCYLLILLQDGSVFASLTEHYLDATQVLEEGSPAVDTIRLSYLLIYNELNVPAMISAEDVVNGH